MVDRVPALLLSVDVLALLLSGTLVPLPSVFDLMLVLGTVAAYQGRGLYRARLTLSIADDLPVVLVGLVAALTVTTVVAMSTVGLDGEVALVLGLFAFVLVLLGRAAAYAVVRAARSSGLATHRTLIVGTGPTATRVARTLEDHPEHGLRVVGFIGPELDLDHAVDDGILGRTPADLGRVALEQRADVVIITHVGDDVASMLKALRNRHRQPGYTLFLVPPLFHLLHVPRGERIRDVALIRVEPRVVHLLAARMKRLLDIAVSVTALVLLAPVLAAVAVAVRVELGSPILFRQTRVGQGGRLFTLYKFSSMRPSSSTESATSWSIQGDVRIGRVGRFIRRTSLDELPQLINIVRGDMSLVGPRPERPHFVDRFRREYDGYPLRHRVRPGLTGWAAVNGLRGDTSIEERAYFDNVYIDNWTFWLDLKIISRTFVSVFGAHGG
ncbi:MAG: sugar transferase [Nocardioidaceae bacterium]|nr:sugar transferase [Nocardioidaceae bacterium]NUS49903.1 sugar transferase [Nocardioidaceae bacterium]